MHVETVRTPTDMRGAINDACRVHFLAIPEEIEPEVRRAWDAIIADFTYMGPNDEPGFIASYLESIEEPLRDLRALGMPVVYLTSKGSMSGVSMGMTDFLIAPTPCHFRVEGDPSALIHLLGAYCLNGHRAFLSGDEAKVALGRSSEAVSRVSSTPAHNGARTCSMAVVGQR